MRISSIALPALVVLFTSACQSSDRAQPGFAAVGPAQPSSPDPTAPAPQAPKPTSPPTPQTPAAMHHLASVARSLALLSESAYDDRQMRWLGTTEPACNFFLATALCEDGLCQDGIPDVLAAGYDTYLLQRGWKQVDLATLKTLLATGADFDAVLQRDGTSAHGHVSIAVGLSSSAQLIVAQGELGSITHQLVEESDSYLTTYDGGMRIFVQEQ